MRLRTLVTTAVATAALCAVLVPPAVATTPAARERAACSPRMSVAGYSDALDKTTVDGRLVGGLSGLSLDKYGRIAAISDKSGLTR
ncbi:hypothetical protein ACIRO3_10985 [Streptomyces sp. NPDC102278]|uniref:hypothetical protein n=1 Tax=Streptomyces sp. NPDC102278 TaxID=3366152 RepID=UPI003825B59D